MHKEVSMSYKFDSLITIFNKLAKAVREGKRHKQKLQAGRFYMGAPERDHLLKHSG